MTYRPPPPRLDYARPEPSAPWRTFRTIVRAYAIASYAVMGAWAAWQARHGGGFAFDDWDGVFLLLAPLTTPLLILGSLLRFGAADLPGRVGTVLMVVGYVAAFAYARAWLARAARVR